jgi:hypothetical protein
MAGAGPTSLKVLLREAMDAVTMRIPMLKKAITFFMFISFDVAMIRPNANALPKLTKA